MSGNAPFADVIDETKRQIEHDYAPPRLKRDAHPKMHGCVQATFTVHAEFHADVESRFREGVFRDAGKTYKAWVRFSNAFGIQHDLEAETRGMAVKLLDVVGSPIREDGLPIPETEIVRDPQTGTETYTQDFLCATYDAFFLPNPDEYLEFIKGTATAPKGVTAFFRRRPYLWRGAIALLRSQFIPVANPLELTYFSQTPYQLGSVEKVKFRIRPTTPELRMRGYRRWAFVLAWWLGNIVIQVIDRFAHKGKPWTERIADRHLVDRDYLRLNMMRFLEEQDATFELRVQPYTDDYQTPIDDATRPWKPRRQDYAVATIRIPRQVFWPVAGMPERLLDATNQMARLGENMSFNPWHTLEAHRPLGRINESRRWIYKAIARFRRDANHVTDRMAEQQMLWYDRLRSTVREGRIRDKVRDQVSGRPVREGHAG